MINAEKVNSIKGFELTTGLKEEKHSSVTQVFIKSIKEIC
jgi:hypothetical protein